MFVSDTHLPQVLAPEAYTSPEFHQREIDKLFLPNWFFVGATWELPKDGSFFTREILGHPIIVWRINGENRAYLNVCAHRMCMLTHKPAGEMPKLKCQYHGWEYDETGNTKRIPDAKSFRPLENGLLGLRTFRCETVGQTIFVTLNENAPSLREHLGPGYEMIEQITAPHWEPNGCGDRVMECNWKIYLENTVESYHAECVHPTSLVTYPPENECFHTFGPKWSLLRTAGKPDNLDRMDVFAHKWLGVTRDPDYYNMLVYPNLAIGKMPLFSWVDQVIPEGPGKLRIIARGFTQTGLNKNVRSRIMKYFVRKFGGKFLAQLVREDSAVLPDVQRGLRSPLQPKGGLISAREERVFHFQKYIDGAVSGSGPALERPAAWLPANNPLGRDCGSGACGSNACTPASNGVVG